MGAEEGTLVLRTTLVQGSVRAARASFRGIWCLFDSVVFYEGVGQMVVPGSYSHSTAVIFGRAVFQGCRGFCKGSMVA